MVAKKSASKANVKGPTPREATPKEQFDEAHKVIESIIDTQRTLVYRPDTYFDVKDEATKHGVELDFEDIQGILAIMDVTYGEMELRIHNWSFEQFSQEELEDPFKDLYAYVNDTEKVDVEMDVFINLIVFQAVRPYAEKAAQLHQLTVESIEKKKK